MSEKPQSSKAGPGRLLGALSLGCFAVTVVDGLVAFALASDRFAAAGAAPGGGGLQFAVSGLIVIAVATLVAVISSLLGVGLGVSGVFLARNNRGKTILPASGAVVNGLILICAAMLFLYVYYFGSNTAG